MQNLDYKQLRARIEPESLGFSTTDDLKPLSRPLGQERALSAIRFGLEVESRGYNLFILGSPGSGRHSTVSMVVEEKAAKTPPPGDWVYLYNFDEQERPLAVGLPKGAGEAFRDDMAVFVKALAALLPKTFMEEPYGREKGEIFRRGQEARDEAFNRLGSEAAQYSFILDRGNDGITLTYAREGKALEAEEFQKLPEEEQKKVREAREVLQESLHKAINEVRDIDMGVAQLVEKLDLATGSEVLDRLLEPLLQKFGFEPKIQAYLAAVKGDVLSNLDPFRRMGEPAPRLPLPFPIPEEGPEELLKRYRVNLLVNNRAADQAPVVFESNPTYHNLIGRMEQRSQFGGFFTDYTMIKPGAFHRANGGYLVLNAREVMINPFAYEALKRVLKDQEIRMEEVGEQYRMIATVTLKPEPIPTSLKVVLLGTPWLYYLLQEYDEDFLKLFKVKGEFADEMELSAENIESYGLLIASLVKEENLLPFTAAGAASVMEHGLRLSEFQIKLSTRFLEITDLVRQAHHWAKSEGASGVGASHVDTALKKAIFRNDYIEELIGEMISDGSILIDLEGSVVGQVNGLSVHDTGDYAFGKPSRVTARVYMGKEGVTNIEREADLGGPIHNKGVMILQGFFGARYAQKVPVSFSATLCFEQSYGGVEGDSASSAELFALISAITDLPLRQDLAVTGSVNQLGQIQAVGGINQKIEGFFKTCKARGLTGTQGVVIPWSNIKNLMLDAEVVDAVKEGRFNIYPIKTVDEGLKLLTGVEAGVPDQFGDYPKGTVNARVIARLLKITAQWRKLHEE